jgi:hypothetical protein
MPSETVTLAFKRYTTDDGKRTCRSSEGACEFLFDYQGTGACIFPASRSSGDVETGEDGRLVPEPNCPLWKGGQ